MVDPKLHAPVKFKVSVPSIIVLNNIVDDVQ